MFELAVPHARFHRSFLAAADEFIAAGEERHANLLAWPADASFPGVEFTRGAVGVAGGVRGVRVLPGSASASPPRPRPRAFVPFTERWMVADGAYVGRISLRHTLTELLLTWGGHIGYSVRPSARRRGHAGRALAMMLPTCAELGIDPVLVTCDTDNVGSRRMIEINGGVYEDTREGKLRYWIPTASASRGDRNEALLNAE